MRAIRYALRAPLNWGYGVTLDEIRKEIETRWGGITEYEEESVNALEKRILADAAGEDEIRARADRIEELENREKELSSQYRIDLEKKKAAYDEACKRKDHPEHPTYYTHDVNDSQPPHDYAPMDMKHAIEQRKREEKTQSGCPVCHWPPNPAGWHAPWCTPRMREDHEIAERARYQLRISSTASHTYLVVNTDEPYAEQVFDLIHRHEQEKGTWDGADDFQGFCQELRDRTAL